MRGVRLGRYFSVIAGIVVAGSLLFAEISFSEDVVPKPRPKPKPVVETPASSDGANIPREITARATVQKCLGALRELGADAQPIEGFGTKGGCGIDDPVKITELRVAGSTITLTGKPMMSCRFALKFADWTANVMAPMAKHHMGAALSQLQVGPGYVCRRRNNAKTGKLSEHAFGNAIDISGLKLTNGERFLIGSPKTANGPVKKFLSAARITACGYFTTVLGPGANAAHASHLHFDSGRHGKNDRYRICQ